MSDSHVIALLTDFGNGSHYVAQMKGVIYGIEPSATIVDVTHAVSAQDVHEAAWLLGEVRDAFPTGTIFVVVVDPGVGSQRSIVVVQTSSATCIGPDNGVLSLVAAAEPEAAYFRVDNPTLWRDPVSATFHGRDIMAPLAAHLAAGTPVAEVGPKIDNIQHLDFPPTRAVGNAVVGRIEYADSFGNLITNIAVADLGEERDWIVHCAKHDRIPLVRCYADGPTGDYVAVFGSGGRLEIAVVSGDAKATLQPGRHEEVICRPQG